jgi:iron-sulfur cluster assembly accessory protein
MERCGCASLAPLHVKRIRPDDYCGKKNDRALTLAPARLFSLQRELEFIMSEAATVEVQATERALRRVAEILSSEAPGSVLRISVNGGGCSGFQYAFDIVPAAEADDILLGDDKARVALDPMSLEFIKGARLDFIDDLMGSAFKFENPNATASCGCGTSFAI